MEKEIKGTNSNENRTIKRMFQPRVIKYYVSTIAIKQSPENL